MDTGAIRRLEKLARELEPDASERERLLALVTDYAEAFLRELDELPAFVETEDGGAGLYETPVRESGRPLDDVLDQLGREVDRPGLNPASPRHFGYIPGGGIYTSALADYLAAVTNRYAGVFFPGPGAVRVENVLIDWLRELVGYPKDTAAGNLTSGGSIGNLMGIVAARDAFELSGRDLHRTVIYSSEQAHHSLAKAVRIAGLSECIERRVPLDDHYRMRADALEAMVREDRAWGRLPFLVTPSAGTTDTGVVDPIDDIATVCEQQEMWLHVDAAYGGFFMLCEEGRKILRGLDRSHSIIMDPHKTLFLPYGLGIVLVRDRSSLLASHHYQPNYLQDTFRARDELSPSDLSPELSKHFRGLRLWLPLMVHGLAPFRAGLEEKLLLARYFHEKISERPRFEVGPFPDLSVVTFRYVPDSGDADRFNEKLVRAIHADGRAFVSSTVLGDKFTLRFAVGASRTHLDDVDLFLQILDELVSDLS